MNRRSFLGFALLAPLVGGKLVTETLTKAVILTPPAPLEPAFAAPGVDTVLAMYKHGLAETFDRELFDDYKTATRIHGDWENR